MLSLEHLIPKHSKHTFFIALLAFLLNQPSSYADDSCQLRHIQCANPSFDSCNNGFGAGQCTQTGDGATNDTCSMIVFPNGFSGSYKDRTVNCHEDDGCEAVNCPAECINSPSVDCQCVAEWGLDSSIRFEPAFCLPGSIDGSCHQQYFKCTTVHFNFCSQGYGAGLCINQEPPGRNCTINYYPNSFNKTVNSSHLSCENPSGCEGIECSDNCHGSWHLNNQTEVSPEQMCRPAFFWKHDLSTKVINPGSEWANLIFLGSLVEPIIRRIAVFVIVCGCEKCCSYTLLICKTKNSVVFR